MLRKILLTFVCLVMLSGMALAQETTPDSEQNYILNWTTEVIFPQAIRFTITLSPPVSELASVVLAIRPQGRSPVAVEVDLNSAVVSDSYSEFVYLWDIPRSAPPRLFQDIQLEWQATTRDGERARVEGKVTFTDQRLNWVRREESPISLTIPEGTSESPENVVGRLRRELQPVYDLLAKNTGRAETFNLIVYVDVPPGCGWTDQDEPIATGPVSETVVTCDQSLADRIFEASGLSVVQSPSYGLNDMRTALVEMLVRRFYNWQNTPDWFTAGIAAFYGPSPRSGDLPRLVAAARNEQLFSLSEMILRPVEADQALWLAQSYGMVVYLASRIGVQGVFNLARDASTAESFDSVFEATLDKPVSALLTDWEQWIFTSQAAAAFGLTPYQASTPTPAPTDTPMPTSTPTVTDTASPVPPTDTPTPQGFEPTLTPLPSETPSRTPRPALPSVTPRPPDSLVTPTLVPALPPELMGSPVGVLGLAAIVLIVIAILAILFTGFRRR